VGGRKIGPNVPGGRSVSSGEMALIAPDVVSLTKGETAAPPTQPYVPTLVIAATTGGLLWLGAATLMDAGRLGATLVGGWVELAGPGFIALVLAAVVCERIWPAEPRRVLASGHVQDACFFLIYVSCVVPVMTVLGVAFATLLGTHAGWIEAPWTASWSLWLVVPLTLVAMDGANWLAHWADHRITALWRLHAVHHSQEELSVLTSFRAHPLVHITGFFLATVPVLLLMGDRPLAPVLITLYVCLGTFPHANVRWSLGPLGKVVVSPAYHRIHHAVDGPDGANLGIVLTIWDVLASRAVFPVVGNPASATGLRGRPLAIEQSDPRSRLRMLVGQLFEPFTARRPESDIV
jgi:sterol desaturase/sphingolipid hydroxylase (fatty acid hydroxylase superfamily)